MKKRVVSILLSVALCVGPVVQAGATEFTGEPAVQASAADVADTAVIPETVQEVADTVVVPEAPQEAPDMGNEAEAPVVTPAETDVQEPQVTETPQATDAPADDSGDVIITPEAPVADATGENQQAEELFGSETVTGEIPAETASEISVIEGGYAVPVAAWENTEDGNWKLRKGTEELTGETFYFTLADGMIRICTMDGETVLSDGYYQFDENGRMMTGYQKIVRAAAVFSLAAEGEAQDEYAYFADLESAVLNAGVPEGTAATPWNSNLGRSFNNSWLWMDGAFHYYGADGKEVSVAELKKEAGFKGYFEIEGAYFYLEDDGKPFVGEKTITEAEGTMPGEYLFLPAVDNGKPGKMCVEGWHKDTTEKGDRYRYYTPKDGDAVGTRQYIRICIVEMAEFEPDPDSELGTHIKLIKLLVDKDGYLLKNQMVKVGSSYYGTDKDGNLLVEKLGTFNGKRYYFASDGMIDANYVNGWHRCVGEQNRYYYFGKTPGEVVEKTSWQKIGGKWYYFGTSGDHLVNILLSNGRYFDENGAMAEGMYKSKVNTAAGKYKMVKDETYYFAPSTAKAKNGVMYKSKWLRLNKNWYYADKNGILLHDILLDNGRLFKADGTMASGFVTADKDITGQGGKYNMKKGERYYFTPSTDTKHNGVMYKSKWLRYNKNWYYADKTGRLLHDILLDNGRLFNPDGTMAGGFVTATKDIAGQGGKYNMKKGEKYYFVPSTETKANGGMYRSKWIRYNNNWYYVDKNGILLHDMLLNNGRLFYSDGTMAGGFVTAMDNVVGQGGKYKMYKAKTYYFAPSTAKKANGGMYKSKWIRYGNNWYYAGKDGVVFKNVLLDNGRYFRADGTMAEGIETASDGKTYFFRYSTAKKASGSMYKNTLISYNGKWYGAGADGQLKKNQWYKYNGEWRYFQNDYTMKTNGFQRMDNGTNVYLDANGKICTGWVVVSNSQNLVRYINPDGNGYYKNQDAWIDGKLYSFDKNGYRINDLTSRYGNKTMHYQLNRHAGLLTAYADKNFSIPVKSFRVSVGNPITRTPTGKFNLQRAGRWQALMGPSWGQYGTLVDGRRGIYIHSVACTYANPYNLPVAQYNMLGNPASHGCIRAAVADAKWVYNHCNGSTLVSGDYKFDANNEALRGPLGRPALVPYAGGSKDPTDTEA